ncbi:MAG: glycosyltransferase, partial [Thermoplasmatota archaeon]
MRCTTVLLIFNEEGNIEPLTRSILEVYDREGIDGEVLLVDDGSEDRSPRICDDLADREPRVRAVHHRKNLNRSRAIQTGFRESLGEVVIIMDGDRQYEPAEIPRFLEKIDQGYDVVTGNRVARSDNLTRRIISKVYN